jgi:hypothetical protein
MGIIIIGTMSEAMVMMIDDGGYADCLQVSCNWERQRELLHQVQVAKDMAGN